MKQPYSDRFPNTFQNELVSCGPCNPQFSRNALLFFRYFKVFVQLTAAGGGVFTSAVGEKGRSSTGAGQVIPGLTTMLNTSYTSNLYEDGAFADNDCYFRQYAWSARIEPNLVLVDDSTSAGAITKLPNNYFTTNYPDEMVRQFSEAISFRMVQRNSSCDFALGRVVDAPQSNAGSTGQSNYSSGLANVPGAELASAICHPGNTGSKRPVFVVEQSVALSITNLAGTPIETSGTLKLGFFVEFKAWGEDVYGQAQQAA